MTILDDAEDFVQRKTRIALLERPGENLPTLDDLKERIKAALADEGNEFIVTRLDKRTGELSPALELRDYNTRLFLRSRAGAWKPYETTCDNCGHRVTGEVRTQSPSVALDSEPIADLRQAAREAQWRPVEVSE